MSYYLIKKTVFKTFFVFVKGKLNFIKIIQLVVV